MYVYGTLILSATINSNLIVLVPAGNACTTTCTRKLCWTYVVHNSDPSFPNVLSGAANHTTRPHIVYLKWVSSSSARRFSLNMSGKSGNRLLCLINNIIYFGQVVVIRHRIESIGHNLVMDRHCPRFITGQNVLTAIKTPSSPQSIDD